MASRSILHYKHLCTPRPALKRESSFLASWPLQVDGWQVLSVAWLVIPLGAVVSAATCLGVLYLHDPANRAAQPAYALGVMLHGARWGERNGHKKVLVGAGAIMLQDACKLNKVGLNTHGFMCYPLLFITFTAKAYATGCEQDRCTNKRQCWQCTRRMACLEKTGCTECTEEALIVQEV